MKHKICLIYSWLVRTLSFFLPDIPFFMRFRGFLYSFCMESCGKNFQVTQNAILRSADTLNVGDNVYIANNCVVLGGGKIIIEDDVLIGPNTVIASRNHTKKGDSFRFGESYSGEIIIGKGSWISANCTIVTDSILPKGSVLAANSVITKKFSKQDSLYAGAPAKFIKEL